MTANSVVNASEVVRTIVAGGVSTAYHDAGPETPGVAAGEIATAVDTVLLLHGSGPGVSAWANWRGVLPDLARTYRVVAPDLLGFGGTAAPGRQVWSMDAWYGHLRDTLDALDLGRVAVIGNSFGGALALRLAVEQPERVQRLVLMGSVGVPFELTEGLEAVWGFTPDVASMRRAMSFFAYDRSRITDDLVALRLAAATRPGVAESFRAMFPAPRQTGIDNLVVDPAAVARLPHSVMLVHGRDDKVIPLATSLQLLRLIPDAQLHVFGRCGHWVQIERQAAFLRLVQEYLSTAAERSSVD